MPSPDEPPSSRDFRAILAAQLREVEAAALAEAERWEEVAAALARENESLRREVDFLSSTPADCEVQDAAAADEEERPSAQCGSTIGGGVLGPANAVVAQGTRHGAAAGAPFGPHRPCLRGEPVNLPPRDDGGVSTGDLGHFFAMGAPKVWSRASEDHEGPAVQLLGFESDPGVSDTGGGSPPDTSCEGHGSLPDLPTTEAAPPDWKGRRLTELLFSRHGSERSGRRDSHSATQSSVSSTRTTQQQRPLSRRASIAQEVITKLAGTRLGAHERLENMIVSEQNALEPDERVKGFCGRLRRDAAFQALFLDTWMGAIILLNIAIMGISSDVAEAWKGWLVVDMAFALIFLAESFLKLSLLGPCVFLTGPDWRWNLFELCLVAMALLEIVLSLAIELGHIERDKSGFSFLRIVRLFRILRIVRVCRLDIFADLMVMVRGVIGGVHVLGWAVVLISLPLYAVALVFRETIGKEQPGDEYAIVECFSSVPMSFYTLFRCIVGGDCSQKYGWPTFLMAAKHPQFGWAFAALYCATTVFMSFGLFNVIVAIFVESVINTAKYNDQLVQRQRLRDDTFFLKRMMELIEVIWCEMRGDGQPKEGEAPHRRWQSASALLDEAADMEITPELFQVLLQNDTFHNILVELDIADEDQFFLFQTLDASGDGKVSLDELMDGIAKLRGDARRSDIIAVHVLLTTIGEEVRELSELVRHGPEQSGEPAAPGGALALGCNC